MITPNKTEKAGLLYHVLDHLKLLSCRYNVKSVVERIRTDDSPHLPPPHTAYNQQLPGQRSVRGCENTHLHHLLDVFLDDCRVSVGLHRHRPFIDHGGLGVRRGGRAGVLLQMREKPKGISHLRGEGSGSCRVRM